MLFGDFICFLTFCFTPFVFYVFGLYGFSLLLCALCFNQLCFYCKACVTVFIIIIIISILKLVNFLQVLHSVQALVHPVRLQKLTIQPVNLLVSIHASLKLYIASDHTPLSFSLFERGPLCTTARQLVHALAMHYAAGALFRAGRC